MSGEFRIAAPKVSQRPTISCFGRFHLTDENRVIAGRVTLLNYALDVSNDIFQNRSPCGALPVSYSFESIAVPGGKSTRNKLLILGKDVNGKVRTFLEELV